MKRLIPALSIAFLLTLAACATSGTQNDRAGRDRNAITQEDIQAATASYRDAYELVQRLHPEWLRKRSGGLPVTEANTEIEGDIVVYLNDVRVGGPDTLRDISVASVAEIRFLDAARAARYGTGHQHGVILVQTR